MSLAVQVFNLFRLHIELKRHGVIYGPRLRGNPCLLVNKGEIVLGEHVFLNSNPGGELFRTGLMAYFPTSRIMIGDDCSLNGTLIHSRKEVIIGKKCLFGPGTIILDNDSHNTSIDPEIRRTGPVKFIKMLDK